MRLLVPTLALALAAALVLPAFTARADEGGDPAARLSRLELETKWLRAEVEYLRARDTTNTRYLASVATAVQNLTGGVARARSEGFEAAAISAPSRVELLHTLDMLGSDLVSNLPVPSKAEIALRAQADDLKKQLPR